jgi:hypothetical protein
VVEGRAADDPDLPAHTGRQVWNRQRKQESLIDVEDVALGHTTRLAWNAPDAWLVSDEHVHPALVDDEVFEQVHRRLASPSVRSVRETGEPGAARLRVARAGAVFGMRSEDVQGTWNHGRAHYRCRFPAEDALANRIEHPAAVCA